MADGVVVLTLEQLKDAMREVIREEREQVAGGLANKKEACRALRVSAYKLDELVKAGMPVVRLGAQSPRYDVAACVEWLKARP